MPEHIDGRIRKKAAAVLADLPTTANRVYPSRVQPMADENCPGLRVYVDDSDIQAASQGGANRLQDRTIQLIVEFCDRATNDYDERADASKLEIERAIANDNTLGGLVKWAQLIAIRTQREEGEKVNVLTRLVFNCQAYTQANTPDTPL